MITATAIIFDLDGTLIDSSEGVVESVNYSLRKMGEEELPPEVIKPFIGYPLSSMYPHFTKAPIDQLYRHFQEKAAETIVASTYPLDGAESVLRDLNSRGLRLAIGTTKVKRHVEGVLEKLGWVNYFDTVVGGDEVDRVKPAPDAFLLALERMNTDAQSTVVVGDTVNDV